MAARKRPGRGGDKRVPPRRGPTPRGVAAKKAKPGKVASSGAPSQPMIASERLAYVRALIRDVPNFPKEGILFRDICPLLADPRGFHITLNALAESFIGDHVDAVVAVESRGFIFGGALAERLNASFVPVRKPGKLPADTDAVAYDLEYATNELHMHRGALGKNWSVLVVDDLLATGGTAEAAGELVRRQGARVLAFAFVVELGTLNGRSRLTAPVVSLLTYD